MTESEISLFEEMRSLNERAATKEREAVILQQQYQSKTQEARTLRERAKAIATQLGVPCT